jgi:hypothetical protein
MGMRQDGLEKLYAAAGTYIRALNKKKEGEDREKSLPPEILGSAMISHGSEYTAESAYGQALVRLGSAMERVGRTQEVKFTQFVPLIPRHMFTKPQSRRLIPWNVDWFR